jgi:hypothetical protein
MTKSDETRGIFPPGRVVGICRIVNDGDVIFTNLMRLAATGITKFVISDLRSTDNTGEEIRRFRAERPDVIVYVVDDPGHHILASKVLTGLAALAARVLDTDWVVPFDADDFVWLAPGVGLPLDQVDVDFIMLPWLQLHPSALEGRTIQKVLDDDRLADVYYSGGPGKVILKWKDDLIIERGQHWLHSTTGRVLTGVRGDEIGAAMVHVPIRSQEQFTRKIRLVGAVEKAARDRLNLTHHSSLGTILAADSGQEDLNALLDAMWSRDQTSFVRLCKTLALEPNSLAYLSTLAFGEPCDFKPEGSNRQWASISTAQKIVAFRRKDRDTKHKVDVLTRLQVALMRMRGYARAR